MLITGIILLSGCTDSQDNISPTAKVISSQKASSTTQSINENNAVPKNQDTPTPETEETLYSMNENIKVDYLTYKIIKVESFTEIGTSISNKKTDGKFVKVYLKIINNAKETKDLFTPRFKIEDDQERRYDRLSDDMFYITDYLEFGRQLQPGLGTSGAIVFEMPKDSKELKLIISGDWLSGTEVKVKLSTITDIEKDTVISSQKASSNTQSINENDAVPKNQDTPAPETEETLYSMNENVKVDYLTYKITKAEAFTEMGTSILNKKTDGKFVKVYLKITNDAKETKDLFTPRFKIEDDQERRYDRLSDDIFYIADYLEFGKQLQPGLGASGAIVFEMPKDSKELKLIISGDWLSGTEVKVKLSTVTDIGKDTTQKEEQDKQMDEIMKESEIQMEEIMNKCNTPFKCSSSCPEYMGVGQKDCPSGQICCME